MDWRTDLAEEGVALLPEVYQQPRFQQLLRVAGRRWQGLENALRTVQEGWWLANAAGVQLDGLGELLLEPRNALGDAEYRLRLLARIRLLRGNGTPDEVLRLMQLLQPTLAHRLVEYFPGLAEVFTSGGALPLPLVHGYLLQRAKPAGVRLVLRYQVSEDADTFTFAGANAGAGFGEYMPDTIGPVEVVTSVGGTPPLLALGSFGDPVPLAAAYRVTAEVVEVVALVVTLRYRLQDGEAWRVMPPLSETEGDYLLTVDGQQSGLLLAIPEAQEGGFMVGDTYAWDVTPEGVYGGGRLTGAVG